MHRVLHFLWSGGIGGAERSVYQIVRQEMARGEWEVGAAFGRAEGPYAEAIRSLGCEVIDLRMRRGADLARALRALSDLRRFEIHHFHAMELGQIIPSTRCDGVTRVFTQRHGRHERNDPARKRARRFLGGVLLRRHFHAVAGNTEHATRYAIAAYGLQHLPSQVTYNGLDFSLLTPRRTRLEVRRDLGLGSEAVVVGSSGTLKGWKRFDRLVALLGAELDVHVVIVGDGGVRSALETQARLLGVSDRLRVTGLVDHVGDYLQAMDIFVLPSSAEESFGNSVVEAMALGLPSIVFSDSPGLCEHMDDGAAGFIVDNQLDLASLIARLATDPALRRQIGEAGAEYVRSKYALENMHDAYRRLYDSALAARSSSSLSARASSKGGSKDA